MRCNSYSRTLIILSEAFLSYSIVAKTLEKNRDDDTETIKLRFAHDTLGLETSFTAFFPSIGRKRTALIFFVSRCGAT